jgi:hypothetical protein
VFRDPGITSKSDGENRNIELMPKKIKLSLPSLLRLKKAAISGQLNFYGIKYYAATINL